MGIMLGSGMKQRKERQTGIGIGEEIEVITEIISFTGRIPADIAVGLRIVAVASAIQDAVFPAVAGVVRTKAGSCYDRRSITSNMELIRVNLSLTDGFFEEAGTKDLKQDTVSFLTNAKDNTGEAGNQLSDGFLFNRFGLLPLDLGFLHFPGSRRFHVR